MPEPNSLVDLKAPLCVFLIVCPKQNAGSVLIPVFDTAYYALSHGTLGFALHGSSFKPFSDWWKFFNSQSDFLK